MGTPFLRAARPVSGRLHGVGGSRTHIGIERELSAGCWLGCAAGRASLPGCDTNTLPIDCVRRLHAPQKPRRHGRRRPGASRAPPLTAAAVAGRSQQRPTSLRCSAIVRTPYAPPRSTGRWYEDLLERERSPAFSGESCRNRRGSPPSARRHDSRFPSCRAPAARRAGRGRSFGEARLDP